MAASASNEGLLIVYTGDGKGKTTAAIGAALRAVGHGRAVLIAQFMKGDIESGEERALSKLGGVKLMKADTGFFRIGKDKLPREEHVKAASRLLGKAKEEMLAGRYGLVVLDEAGVAKLGLVETADLLDFARSRPARTHVVITGRGAPEELVSAGDIVTEMREVKHPFQKGAKARKGIEY